MDVECLLLDVVHWNILHVFNLPLSYSFLYLKRFCRDKNVWQMRGNATYICIGNVCNLNAAREPHFKRLWGDCSRWKCYVARLLSWCPQCDFWKVGHNGSFHVTCALTVNFSCLTVSLLCIGVTMFRIIYIDERRNIFGMVCICS